MMTLFYKCKVCAVTVLLYMLSIPSSAQSPDIKLRSRTDNEAIDIIVKSIYDFESDISLKLKQRTNKDDAISDIIIKTVSKMDVRDAKGVRITSGFDIDVSNKILVAFSGGTSEIIKATQTPDSVNLVTSFKDKNGHFVTPPKSALAVLNPSGKKLCFDYQNVQQAAPKMAFTLLLDKSGSMIDVIEDVKDTARHFLKILPPSSLCAVASFNSKWAYSNQGFHVCSSDKFGFETITAGGGIDIYGPLENAFRVFASSRYDDYQKAIIIVTDGYTVKNEAKKAALFKLKGDSLTFVYFLGGSKKDDLDSLTDHFFAKGSDIKVSLSGYFSALSKAYRTQKVLKVTACGA